MRIRLNQKRLLERLAQSKLSQNHWALKLGLSRGHWSGIVNGKHPYPSKKTRDLLVEVLGIPFEELFTHEVTGGAELELQAALADRYLLDSELGQGGMGTVHLARDLKHGRTVAVKVVSTEAVSGIGAERFLKEIRYASQLEHPHILPLYDSGEAAGHPYYVMPYIRGGSLRDRLDREGALPLAQVLPIAWGVARALQYAHDRQVAHCDVKPENILLADSHAYVADFGISRAIHSEVYEWGRRQELDAYAGTPAYVSPEQASGEEHLDARSDVYSMGCVLFEMLSGEKPFGGTTTMNVVSVRFHVPVPELRERAPELSRGVSEAVAGAMRPERDRRTGSTMELLAALEEGAAEGPRSFPVAAAARATSRVRSLARRILSRWRHTNQGAAMESLLNDIRYSARRLRRAPGFTLAAVVILALGIGGNSSIFSVLKSAILADPPYPEPDRLVLPSISHVYPTYTYDGASYPEFEMIRDYPGRLVDPIAAYSLENVTVAGTGGAERIQAEVVTPEYFGLLGARAMLGRTFTSEEGDRTRPSMVAVLSERLWAGRYGRDPEVLGREIQVNGRAVSVVGVMPRGFGGVTGQGQIWMPMAAAGVLQDAWRTVNPGAHWFSMLGRLRDGVTIQDAEAQLQPLVQEERARWPDHGIGGELSPRLRPFRAVATNAHVKSSILLLSLAAILVFLIVCANLAGLLLARTSARNRETAVRFALGAGRWRVARQCLVESLLVGAAGGALGLVLAGLGVDALAALSPVTSFAGADGLLFLDFQRIHIDKGVVFFTLGLSLLAGLAFGLLPALRVSQHRQMEGLSASAGSDRSGRWWGLDLRSALVSGQAALALVLLVGAGLVMSSLAELRSVDTGIDAANLLTFTYTLPRTSESTSPHVTLTDADARLIMAFHQSFLERLRGLPGVESATMGCPPPSGFCSTSQVQGIAGRPEIPESEWVPIGALAVDPAYFQTLGVRWVEGRPFSSVDAADAPRVLILSQEAARLLFPGERALGQRLALGHGVMPEGTTGEVVGVVSDVLYGSPEVGMRPVVYLPSSQVPQVSPTFILRTARDPMAVLPVVREALRELDPGIPLHRAATMEALASETTRNTRLVIQVLSIFAALATLLAVLGIYSAVAYLVSLRNREFGIRIALGAHPGELVRLVLRRGALAAGVGVVVGLAGALAASRLLSSLLFEVGAADLVVYGLSASLLFGATLLAGYLPARRAGRTDAIRALRWD